MICSSGIAFDPVVGGRRLTFGFHGIYQGTAVLYDHQTGSHWMHLTGACFEGELKGVSLKRLGSTRHTPWADWRKLHPSTLVLKEDPRWMDRPGDAGYFSERASRRGDVFLPDQFKRTIQTRDARLELSDLVYGVTVGKSRRAYPFQYLAGRPIVEEEIGSVPISVWYDVSSRSANAFDRRAGGRVLSFRDGTASRKIDRETKSQWTMDGVCVRGPMKGRRLQQVFGLQSEWYGWYALHPGTSVWRP